MAGSERQVLFFFGLGSRYSYLAATQIEVLERDTGCRVHWRPLLSSELMRRHGRNPFANRDVAGNGSGAQISGQYDAHYRRTDLARWARHYGIRYHEPREPAMPALRRTLFCVAAEMLGQAALYARAMFAAIYVDNIVVSEADCLRLADTCGIDPAALRRRVDDGAAERHEKIIAEAQALNVFGVPSFVVQAASGPQLFWGNDRIVLLRDYLTR